MITGIYNPRDRDASEALTMGFDVVLVREENPTSVTCV